MQVISWPYFWAHNNAEPRPEQLKQLHIVTLPSWAHMLATRHNRGFTVTSALLDLMCPSLWDSIRLEWSDQMTFYHCFWDQSLYSVLNWRPFLKKKKQQVSMISGFLEATHLFSSSTLCIQNPLLSIMVTAGFLQFRIYQSLTWSLSPSFNIFSIHASNDAMVHQYPSRFL